MKKINENTKITLTVGQIKKLIRESDDLDMFDTDEEDAYNSDTDFKVQDGILMRYVGTGRGNIEIPEGVKIISQNVFAYRDDLTSVKIPSSVQSIGDHAFYHCDHMTSVTIPEGVTRIENCAFLCCFSLKSMTIPKSVRIIGADAFSCIGGVPSLTIPEGVKRIGKGAFSEWRNLTSVIITSSATILEDLAFGSCEKLTKLRAPWSLIKKNPEAFKGSPVYDKIKVRLEEENA